jgi:hypothetical protein
MATYTANVCVNATTAANVVDTINLTCPATNLMVTNLDHAGQTIYFRFADASQGAATPTVGGNDCYAVNHGPAGRVVFRISGAPIQIKIISSGTQNYSVAVI